MAITASIQPESSGITYVGANFPHPVQFCSSKEGPGLIMQNQPGSDLDGLVRFGPNGSGPEASCMVCKDHQACSSRLQLACYHFPHFQTQSRSSTDSLDHIVQNQPGSALVLADPVRFWPDISGPEASWGARISGPASDQDFIADPDWT